MKVAIVSDFHGNLVALDAVLADLERVNPDLIAHGGDLAFNGPRPVECVDRIRELRWPGVLGNMDRALENPTGRRVTWASEQLGRERNAWLQSLPMEWRQEDRVALVHAVPGDLWQAVFPEADDDELLAIYGPLGARVAVYCHIHRPFVRKIRELTVANSGSVGLPFDGDPRASYLVIEDGHVENRRVDYDVDRAVADVLASGLPEADAVATMYRTARPQL
ncbi:MAG TPA: metallophosphoesterase family protein [Candidatus Dormibacteraeota bacterium]|nr:metallophosphoesterase family protein [Candidatus Dormibacteraeota bacterium]